DDDIKQALHDSGLNFQSIERLKEQNKPAKTVKITLTHKNNRDTLIKTGLKVGYCSLSAEAAKPKTQDICRKCGGNHTTNNRTANEAKCLNCSNQHEANSASCPKYIEQQQKIRKIIGDYTSEIKVPSPMTTTNFPSLTKIYHSAHQYHQADEHLEMMETMMEKMAITIVSAMTNAIQQSTTTLIGVFAQQNVLTNTRFISHIIINKFLTIDGAE
ncbi:unnamed protein product, partial [Didymodactylos carnosus]